MVIDYLLAKGLIRAVFPDIFGYSGGVKLIEVVERALASLPLSKGEKDPVPWDREKMVLEYRFGLKDGRKWKLFEIAEKLGLRTYERPRQIVQNALKQLAILLVKEGIKKFLIPPIPVKIMILESRLKVDEYQSPIEDDLKEAICRATIGHPGLYSRILNVLRRENVVSVPQLVIFLNKNPRKIKGLWTAGMRVLREVVKGALS